MSASRGSARSSTEGSMTTPFLAPGAEGCSNAASARTPQDAAKGNWTRFIPAFRDEHNGSATPHLPQECTHSIGTLRLPTRPVGEGRAEEPSNRRALVLFQRTDHFSRVNGLRRYSIGSLMEGICNATTLAPFLDAGILFLGRKLVVQVVHNLDCTVRVNKGDERQDRNPTVAVTPAMGCNRGQRLPRHAPSLRAQGGVSRSSRRPSASPCRGQLAQGPSAQLCYGTVIPLPASRVTVLYDCTAVVAAIAKPSASKLPGLCTELASLRATLQACGCFVELVWVPGFLDSSPILVQPFMPQAQRTCRQGSQPGSSQSLAV